ncbi:MAG: hypothetical protein ACI8P0_000594 [Planctomycetaceae bacterium]
MTRPALTVLAATIPPIRNPVLPQEVEELTMQTPIETNALYLVVSAVPLLHGLDRDIVDTDDNCVAVGRDVRRLPSAETSSGPKSSSRILNNLPEANEKLTVAFPGGVRAVSRLQPTLDCHRLQPVVDRH